MRNLHLKISHMPKKYCHLCKREVYCTTHRASDFYVDWYSRDRKVFCVECYK